MDNKDCFIRECVPDMDRDFSTLMSSKRRFTTNHRRDDWQGYTYY